MIAILFATSLVNALPYLAILIALGTFVASQREFGRRAKVDYVTDLERRIEICEADRERMHRKSDDQDRQLATLKDENFELLRRMLDLGKETK